MNTFVNFFLLNGHVEVNPNPNPNIMELVGVHLDMN